MLLVGQHGDRSASAARSHKPALMFTAMLGSSTSLVQFNCWNVGASDAYIGLLNSVIHNLSSLPDRVGQGAQRTSRTDREVADLATARTAAAAAVDRLLRHCRQSTDASEVAAAEASALAKDGSGALSLQKSDEHCGIESTVAAAERGPFQSRPGALQPAACGDDHIWDICVLVCCTICWPAAWACKAEAAGWAVP